MINPRCALNVKLIRQSPHFRELFRYKIPQIVSAALPPFFDTLHRDLYYEKVSCRFALPKLHWFWDFRAVPIQTSIAPQFLKCSIFYPYAIQLVIGP